MADHVDDTTDESTDFGGEVPREDTKLIDRIGDEVKMDGNETASSLRRLEQNIRASERAENRPSVMEMMPLREVEQPVRPDNVIAERLDDGIQQLMRDAGDTLRRAAEAANSTVSDGSRRVAERLLERFTRCLGVFQNMKSSGAIAISLVIGILTLLRDGKFHSFSESDHDAEVRDWLEKRLKEWKETVGSDDVLFWSTFADNIDETTEPRFTLVDEMSMMKAISIFFPDTGIPETDGGSVWTWADGEEKRSVDALVGKYTSTYKVTNMFREAPNRLVRRKNHNGEIVETHMPKVVAAQTLQLSLQVIVNMFNPKLPSSTLHSISTANPIIPDQCSIKYKPTHQIVYHNSHHVHKNGTKSSLLTSGFPTFSKTTSNVLTIVGTLSWATGLGPFVSGGIEALKLFGGGNNDSLQAAVNVILEGVREMLELERVHECAARIQSCIDWFDVNFGEHSTSTVFNADGLETMYKDSNGIRQFWAATDSLYEAVNNLTHMLDTGVDDKPDVVSILLSGATMLMIALRQMCLICAQLSLVHENDETAKHYWVNEFQVRFSSWKNYCTSPWIENLKQQIIRLRDRRMSAVHAIQQGGPLATRDSDGVKDNEREVNLFGPTGLVGTNYNLGWGIQFYIRDDWPNNLVIPKPDPGQFERSTTGHDWTKEMQNFDRIKNIYTAAVKNLTTQSVDPILQTIEGWQQGPQTWNALVPPPAPGLNRLVVLANGKDADQAPAWNTLETKEVPPAWVAGNLLFYTYCYSNTYGTTTASESPDIADAIAVPDSSCDPLLLLPVDPSGIAHTLLLFRSVMQLDDHSTSNILVASIKLDLSRPTITDEIKRITYISFRDNTGRV